MSDHGCLDCVGRIDVEEDCEEVTQLKKKFKEFENITDRNWGHVDLAAKQFKSLILQTSLIGVHPEKVFPPSSMAKLLTSFLASGIVNEAYVSEIFCTVYHCVRLSKKYHVALYNERRFWCILFERILYLPDVQFFEAVMIFVMVVCQIFTEKTKPLCCSRYLVTVDSYQYITGHFHPEKFFPIFKKLLDVQAKNITSNDTAFTVDYRNCVSPLFAPSVAEAEWFVLKKNCPVEFMSILIHMFLTRPVMLELLFIQAPGVPVLMSAFRSKSCKHMHASMMFCLDAMLSIDNECKYNLFLQLMKNLDFPLILNMAVNDDLHYLRALAQKVILHTLSFIETGRKKGLLFNRPRKKDLLAVDYARLKDMISAGGMDDKVFAFVIVKERIEDDRELIMKENFQDFAACILYTSEEKMSHCKPDLRGQLITVALNFLVTIGPLEAYEYPGLMRMFTIESMYKFFKEDDEDIRLLSRACVVNLCHLNFDKRIELLKLYSITSTIIDMYDVYKKYQRKEIREDYYFQLMPINLKLIHSLLTVQHRVKTNEKDPNQKNEIMDFFKPSRTGNKSGIVCITGEKWKKMMDNAKAAELDKSAIDITTDTANKLMEMLVSSLFETNVPDLLHVVSVACMAHLMHDEKSDFSTFLTEKVLAYVLKVCENTPGQSLYLTEGGDFKSIYRNNYSNGLKNAVTKEQQQVTSSKTNNGKSSKKNQRKLADGKSKDSSESLVENTSKTPSSKQKSDAQKNPEMSSKKQTGKQSKEFMEGIEGIYNMIMEAKKPVLKQCAFPACPNNNSPDSSTGEVKKLKKCGRCRNITYCSRECQVKHWPDHKKLCVSKT